MQKINTIGNIKVIIRKDYFKMSEVAAALLVKEINETFKVKEKPVIVLTAGDTPTGTYKLLRTKYKEQLDWSKIILFQMDEYIGLPPNHGKSFAHYLLTNIINPLGIKNFYLFNDRTGKLAMNLNKYERELDEKGGIDIVVYGIGENGHLGFNEPGSSFNSKTRTVVLNDSTIAANSRSFGSVNKVPERAVTMGLDTLYKAKKAFLLASGDKKLPAIINSIKGKVNIQVPASILQKHSDITAILDKKACCLIA